MGVVRIGVKAPRHIKASSVNEADEIALRFARSEKNAHQASGFFYGLDPNGVTLMILRNSRQLTYTQTGAVPTWLNTG